MELKVWCPFRSALSASYFLLEMTAAAAIMPAGCCAVPCDLVDPSPSGSLNNPFPLQGASVVVFYHFNRTVPNRESIKQSTRSIIVFKLVQSQF